MVAFAERLKELRLLYSFDQKYMAHLFDVTPVAWGRWEAGTREPKLDTVAIIASYFCISIDWLLGISDDMRQEYYYSRKLLAFLTDPSTDADSVVHLQREQRLSSGNLPVQAVNLSALIAIRDDTDHIR